MGANNRFLYKIANELFSKHGNDLSNILVVFPSRRAHVFFTDELSNLIDKPIWLPKFYSIEDFFFKVINYDKAHKLDLFFTFYKLYTKHVQNPQTIDQCYKWVPILLEDFDEIDKSYVDYIKLFNYLSDIKRLDSWDLELSEQKEFANNYLGFFDKLKLLYEEFIKELDDKLIAYSGFSQRKLADNPSILKNWLDKENFKKVIFIGLDALTRSQEIIIDFLLKNKVCEIYWDSDKYFLEDDNQESAKFLRKYQYKWPALFKSISSHFLSISKQIDIYGLSKNISQSKFLGNILLNRKYNYQNIKRTAIILSDESLLSPVLESLPPNIDNINVTMGYNLANHPIISIYSDVQKLFFINSSKKQNQIFASSDIIGLLENPHFQLLINKSVSDCSSFFIDSIYQNGLKFLTKKELSIIFSKSKSKILKTIFLNKSHNLSSVIIFLSELTTELVSVISQDNIKSNLEQECLFEIEKILKLISSFLSSLDQDIDIKTFFLFFNQLIKSQKLNFVGEPLKGIQIMGILESRTIDFDEVFILSANEGYLPPSTQKNSFIPIDVKLLFSIRTHLDDDAIYANHFFNLIKRPSRTNILYNNDTSAFGNYEKSRFLQQLIYEFHNAEHHNISIQEHIVSDVFTLEKERPSEIISKDKFILNKINKIFSNGISASAINSYNYCQKEFYFEKILNIKKEEPNKESIDQIKIGLIIHDLLKNLYTPYLNQKLNIKMIFSMKENLDNQIRDSLNEYDIYEYKRGKNLLIIKAVERIVNNYLSYEMKDIKEGNEIIIKCLDDTTYTPPQILNIKKGDKKVFIRGIIDRVDIYNGQYRIIDYKTGNFRSSEIQCTSILELNLKPKLLQLLFYSLLFHKSQKNIETPIIAGIIHLRNNNFQFQPCSINKNINIDTDVLINFESELEKLVLEISNAKKPFIIHPKQDECRFCN